MEIVVIAMVWIVAEKPLCRDSAILLEMKYETFKVFTNFSAHVQRKIEQVRGKSNKPE